MAVFSQEEQWPIFIGALIIIVTISDSVAAGASSTKVWLSHSGWVAAMTWVVFKVVEFPNAVFLLAVLWFIHAMRSLPALWLGERGWWLWPAWIRDSAVALMLFLWSPRVLLID